MNTDQNQPSKSNGNGCFIKIILGVGILFLASAINVVLTGSGKSNPLIAIVVGCSFIGLLVWKPGQSGNSTEIDVKPLDKKDED